MKLGRNDPCWCGSGAKFKKCHLGREAQPRPERWEIDEHFRKAFSSKLCSAPASIRANCSGHIVRAHTVPRSRSLSRIARNGHVYAFVPSLENLAKNDGLLHPQLLGVNKASTFTGFCSVHDDRLFAPIEKLPFVDSPEQCFLLLYRSYAREIFTKTSAMRSAQMHRTLDRGRSVAQQVFVQATSDAYELGLAAAMKDIDHHRPRFERVLLSRDFSSVRAYVLAFADPPPVMCSGAFAPEQDFDGKVLQDLADLEVVSSLISISSFATATGGRVILTWLEDADPVCVPFVESLDRIADADVASALVRFMFEFIENVQISPAWWEGLTSTHRAKLIERMASSADPDRDRPPMCLAPDGWTVAPWSLLSRRWLGGTANAA